MEYFVIYDLNDDIIAYVETKQELSTFTGLRVYDINYKFKNKNFIRCFVDNKTLFVYKFC
ncbi:hypothetical protein EGR52_09915 [bacterium]|nr:hypothetical protein [bacterium]